MYAIPPEDDVEGEINEPGNERTLDSAIIRIFPAFVVLFGLIGIAAFIVAWDSHSLGQFIYALGLSYALGFAILGLPAAVLSGPRIVSPFISVPVSFAAAALMGTVLWFVFGDGEESVNDFIMIFAEAVGMDGDISWEGVVVGICVLLAAVILATYGVLAVVCAYFRRNYHRILLSMMKPGESKLKRRSLSLFAVPDIIDVTDVELEPEESGGFSRDVFLRVFKYTVGTGLIIASYLFLNPVFLDTINFTDMMATMVLISLFITVLVVPVSILRSLGAEAVSAAPRPYVLWKGMKAKMFRWWLFVFLMLTLLWICLYTGADTVRIFFSYLGYIVFVLCMSAVSSFIYANTFYRGLRDGIADRFAVLHRRRKG
ncbi:MAG: hypothetical protein LKJ94_03095 [Candidatus Methanomethylophilus sp.]|jgi:hypothetical protein|nr:hypothetical protein [Methanomethylophilus sp.]MCI2093434.1 hypothetical protein [Methanomethylophilus sp.]